MPPDSDTRPSAPPLRDATLFEVAAAVFCSFLGIRKSSAMQGVRVKPVQVVILGILGAAMFVATLLLLVRFIMTHT